MTIFVINPNASTVMTRSLQDECEALPGLHHELAFLSSEKGPASIEGHSDGARAAYYLTEKVRTIESEAGADANNAYVIACFDDTGLDATRELTAAPVIGVGEAAMHAASLISHKFCIMTTLHRSIPILERNVEQYGFKTKCAGVFASGIAVLELESNPDSYEKILTLSRRALAEYHGESLVLGCAGMSHWVGRLEADLGVPVIDGVRCAVKLAETLIDLNLRTSKVLSYKFPESKQA